jgi:hypothetical protein
MEIPGHFLTEIDTEVARSPVGGLSMAALPCCTKEDVEAGVQAPRVDRPVYPRRVELNTLTKGGNRRWAETACRPVGLAELADDPENVVRDVQQASLKKGNAASFPPRPAALSQPFQPVRREVRQKTLPLG